MNQIVEVENLSISFGDLHVLESLFFEVDKGEILGVIGPNGAGKTTVINAVMGLVKPNSGRILLKGRDITHETVSKRCRLGIGRTYQTPHPFENMTVFENVLMGAVYGTSLSEKKSRNKVIEIINQNGLLEKKDVFAGKLGLLDRKRLELARALATDPEVLLLDEVAGGLTEAEVKDVMKIVKDIQKQGVSVIWIEHILMTMLECADRVMCISGGKNLVCGLPNEVMNSKGVQKVYLGDEDN